MCSSDLNRLNSIHENIRATRVVTLSGEELGTMFKNDLRGVTLRLRSIMEINFPTIHLRSTSEIKSHTIHLRPIREINSPTIHLRPGLNVAFYMRQIKY